MIATFGSKVARSIPRGRRGAVSCGHPLATQAGIQAFTRGGNAVDAAVSAAYALMVVLPEACGIGGDALFLVSRPDGTDAFVGSGLSPTGFGGDLATDGAATMTVPGAVAALDEAGSEYGRLARRDHLAAAIALALDGFPVTEALLGAVDRQRARLERGAPGSDLLKASLRAGALLRFPALAETLALIAAEGSAAFYSGPVAAAIAKAARADGSALTMTDLEQHRTLRGPALTADRLGAVVSVTPPLSQAVLALMALGVLDDERGTELADRVHVGIEAIQAAFAHRSTIAERDTHLRLLDMPLAVVPSRALHRGGPTQQTHTTMVTAADDEGTVVSMVISLYDEFGCATLVPEHGVFLNDRMLGFDADPGSPNRARPAARPVHTLSPVVVDDGGRRYAVATPGADGQVQTVTQVIDGVLRQGLDLSTAVDRPRWRASDDSVILEEGFDPAAAEELTHRGHRLVWKPRLDRSFGAVSISGVELAGTTFAVADLRREAAAAVL